MCRNTVNNINFHYRINLVKISDQIFQKVKKTVFTPIFLSFSQFWEQKHFPENLVLSGTTSYGFHIAPCQNLEKSAIPRKCQYGRTEGRNNGRLQRPFWLPRRFQLVTETALSKCLKFPRYLTHWALFFSLFRMIVLDVLFLI